ncbi:hypothetical protein GE061_014138 [Apolygus lucorum]|uniref:Uncharacterized protein n=1 Tax=Apolygus lucorum TaxID=248454 RepID=A0A8S9XTU8_APOLU|nr:hypothetical protein GE061_014138 [Apolygus lucorum]
MDPNSRGSRILKLLISNPLSPEIPLLSRSESSAKKLFVAQNQISTRKPVGKKSESNEHESALQYDSVNLSHEFSTEQVDIPILELCEPSGCTEPLIDGSKDYEICEISDTVEVPPGRGVDGSETRSNPADSDSILADSLIEQADVLLQEIQEIVEQPFHHIDSSKIGARGNDLCESLEDSSNSDETLNDSGPLMGTSNVSYSVKVDPMKPTLLHFLRTVPSTSVDTSCTSEEDQGNCKDPDYNQCQDNDSDESSGLSSHSLGCSPLPPSPCLDEHHADENEEETRQIIGKKRKSNPALWIAQKKKLLRNSGKAYETYKSKIQVSSRKVGPSCGPKCRLKCPGKVCEEERQRQFSGFWGLKDLQRQREYIVNHSQQIKPKYRYSSTQDLRREPDLETKVERNRQFIELRFSKMEEVELRKEQARRHLNHELGSAVTERATAFVSGDETQTGCRGRVMTYPEMLKPNAKIVDVFRRMLNFPDFQPKRALKMGITEEFQSVGHIKF